jgi:hypothetical protein
MSTVCTLPRQERSQDGPPAPAGPAPDAVEFHYTQTDSFVALLHQLRATLLVTTYQANKLLVVRAARTGLSRSPNEICNFLIIVMTYGKLKENCGSYHNLRAKPQS